MVTETIGGLQIPVFFPSVSSVAKNVLTVENHIDILTISNYDQFLLSCFDINNLDKEYLEKLKSKIINQNQIILLDSGIYELVWTKQKWKESQYFNILEFFPYSQAFSFDDYFLNGISDVKSILNSLEKSTKHGLYKGISPIVHSPNDHSLFKELVPQISTMSKPALIALPERELGKGVFEIAKNIKKIRTALSDNGIEQNLHILGTGNPISLMIYYFAGAQSFDGLDWCQTVVDFEKADLHHYQHLDLYSYQSQIGEDRTLPFLARCFLHNLEFYTSFTQELRNLVDNKARSEYLFNRIKNKQIYGELETILWT